MTNNSSNATCPEIANQNDSEIELSTYNTSAGTYVAIGCKGFGRHVSDPTNVLCLDNGTWSAAPDLKCKTAFDDKESILLGAAIVSAVLVLFVLTCICCYCCCCRRRRRHRWHRYRNGKDWREGWKDDWQNGWTGWGSRKEFRDYPGDEKEKKGGWWQRWRSRNDIGDYPGHDKEKKGGWWTGWRSRKDIGDYPEDNKEKKGGWFREWNSRKDFSDSPGDNNDKKEGWMREWNSRKDFGDSPGDNVDKKEGWMREWNSRKDFGDSPGDNVDKKEGWMREWNSRKDFGDSPGDNKDKKEGWMREWNSRKDFGDSPGDNNDKKEGWMREWNSRKDFGDSPGDNKDKKDGWMKEYNSRKDFSDYPGNDKEKKWGWWRQWGNRFFGDSGAENSRHYRDHETNGNPDENFRRGHGNFYGSKERRSSFSNGSANIRRIERFSEDDKLSSDRKEIIRSGTYYDYSAPTRVRRRFSDPSLGSLRHRYGGHEVTYESKPSAVEYHRVRRYSDPMVNRFNYVRPREEIVYESKPVILRDNYKPSYTVVKTEENPQTIIERAPAAFRHNTTGFRYASPEVLRLTEPTHVLDPVYYTDSRHYRSAPRQYNSLHSGNRSRHTYGGRGDLLLAPLPLDKISKYVNFDLNHRNVGRVSRSARYLELDNVNQHGHSLLSNGGVGLSAEGHYEVASINPSTSYFFGRQDYDRRPKEVDKVDDYVLYRGKRKAREVLAGPTDYGVNSRIIY